MKAITLIQPWATAMRAGLKCAETRSWSTRYRGILAIHAGKKVDAEYTHDLVSVLRERVVLPAGAVLGVVELHKVEVMTEELVQMIERAPTQEIDWGNWQPGRFAWWTKPVVWFREPIPAVGRQGLWNWQEPADWRERG